MKKTYLTLLLLFLLTNLFAETTTVSGRVVDINNKPISSVNILSGKIGTSSNQDGYFKTTKTTVESVKNNIRLLLQTEQGERAFQPFLGMGLKRFVFEQITEDTKIQIENNIVDVFETWLPFVELKDIQIGSDSVTEDSNKININIVFSIKRASNSTESVGVVLE